MSDLINELEQFAISAGEDIGLKLAELAWRKLTGSDEDTGDAIKAIAEHTAQVAKAAALAKAAELAQLAQVMIVQGVDDLLARAEDVLASFVAPALPSVPKLDLDVSFDTSESETPPDGTKP